MLTEQQQKVAQAPWRSTPEELIEVMNLLANFENVALFGALGSPVIMDIQKAALTRNIPIPQGFQKILKLVDSTGSSGWTRKQA